MNFKLSLVLLFFSALNDHHPVFSQNIDSIINEKVHLTEEDTESMNQNSNLNEEENERIKQQQLQQQAYLNTYQQTTNDQQQIGDLTEIQQQIQSTSEVQTKKIHLNYPPARPMFSNPNLNTISKTNANYVLSKPRPIITHSHNSFSELDNQQVVQQQFDNDMDNSFVAYQSTPSTFTNLDSQHDNNWPLSSNSDLSGIKTISNGGNKPNGNAGEFTVNSNTLNFTSQGLDNLKVFNLTSTNHILPIKTFTSIIPNYNQQDALSPMQIIANPIQNLVLRSFESFRRLIKNCESIESFLIMKMNLPKYSKLHRLDPLELPESFFYYHRDPKTPLLGKLKFTLDNVQINGLSTFKTENLSNQGRTLYFRHRIPQLDY